MVVHGMNEMVLMPQDNMFSFYKIPLPYYGSNLLKKYIDIKCDILYGMTGDRAVSSLRKVYNNITGSYTVSVIVGIKDENEVFLKLKYEDSHLLYVIPSTLCFDIFMESIPIFVDQS